MTSQHTARCQGGWMTQMLVSGLGMSGGAASARHGPAAMVVTDGKSNRVKFLARFREKLKKADTEKDYPFLRRGNLHRSQCDKWQWQRAMGSVCAVFPAAICGSLSSQLSSGWEHRKLSQCFCLSPGEALGPLHKAMASQHHQPCGPVRGIQSSGGVGPCW